jgi:hypothetical protein
MADQMTRDRLAEALALNTQIDAAHERANRTALLEHARMGRSVPESRNGQVVWITPEEIFARYGLDANGKPIAPPPS